MLNLPEKVRKLYDEYGQRKQMGLSSPHVDRPHFFLHRPFSGDQDLLIIFNTKRCKYQCYFCQLPAKCSKTSVSGEHILRQFEYVINEMKHSLSILTRITLSNEGSLFDTGTFPTNALLTIVLCVNELRLVRRLVIETRLEFVDLIVLKQIKQIAPKIIINILTGFETKNKYIRDKILFKKESMDVFLSGLDKVAKCKAELTSYVLFKPSPFMTDEEAYEEAETSIDFLADECKKRKITLFIRLNPMYMASGSKWAKMAKQNPQYKPPKLTDVMKLAQEARNKGINTYIGLSTEGLDEPNGNYMSREDYSATLVKPIKKFNDGKISNFDGII